MLIVWMGKELIYIYIKGRNWAFAQKNTGETADYKHSNQSELRSKVKSQPIPNKVLWLNSNSSWLTLNVYRTSIHSDWINHPNHYWSFTVWLWTWICILSFGMRWWRHVTDSCDYYLLSASVHVWAFLWCLLMWGLSWPVLCSAHVSAHALSGIYCGCVLVCGRKMVSLTTISLRKWHHHPLNCFDKGLITYKLCVCVYPPTPAYELGS